MTKNGIKLNDIIESNFEPIVSGFEGKYTKTSLFLLRALDIDIYDSFTREFLVNAYIDDKEYEHDYKRPVFVLFRVKKLSEKKWNNLHRKLQDHQCHRTDYIADMQNGDYLMMYVFEFPDNFIRDYYSFKKGAYSKFSDEFKALFPEKIMGTKGSKVDSLAYGIIHKNQIIKDIVVKLFGLDDESGIDEWDEIWDIPRKETEYYRIIPEQDGTKPE